MPKLTTAYVNGLKTTGARYTVTDDSLAGYEIRVGASGVKTAAIRYRRGRKIERYTIGRIGEGLPPAEARKRARDLLGDVAKGRNPADDRRRRIDAPTLAQVAERFMEVHARPYCKKSTADKYAALLAAHLLPKLGDMPIEDITRADAERLHQTVGKKTPGQANRVIALLSVIMAKAEIWGFRPMQSNPCYKLPKFKERKIERYLTGEERARLESSIAVAEAAEPGQPAYVARGAITAIRLLSLTGTRCEEIVGLQWPWVDLERACLRLPDSKTGAKVVPLSAQAVAFLRELAKGRQQGIAWVCPNECGRKLGNIQRAWQSIRKRAGLEDLRLHDLRHAAASDAAEAGLSLPQIGQVLGHKSPQTTARYTHLADRPRREAARLMGEQIERNTREGAERLRQERERGKLAAGAEHGRGEVRAGEGEGVTATVIPFPGRGRR